MNKIIYKFLLRADTFMPELHLKQSGFTYSPCRPFTKHRKRIKKFRETGNLKHLYKNELDKPCFVHDAATSDCKYLAKRTISDKFLKDKAYRIARNRNYERYQRELVIMAYTFFDKKTGSEVNVNEKLAKKLHKAVIKKVKRRNFYTRFKDNIWAVRLLSK